MIHVVDVTLLAFLVLVSIAVTRMTNLFATSVLTGVYSLLMACIFTVLDAVDVAFTEAAVGAGISTVLFLATLSLTTQREKPQQSPPTGQTATCVSLYQDTQRLPSAPWQGYLPFPTHKFLHLTAT